MKALRIACMISQLNYDDPKAYATLGSYAALVYTMPKLGGCMADRFIGYQHSFLFGSILMTLEHFILALPADLNFFYGKGIHYLWQWFFQTKYFKPCRNIVQRK